MKWLYLPEPVAEFLSPFISMDDGLLHTWSGIETQPKSSQPESETDSSPMHPSGPTLTNSTGETPSVGRLLTDWLESVTGSSSPGDFPASHSQAQESGNPTMTPEMGGPVPFALLEKSDLDTSTLRMYGDSSRRWIRPQMSLFTTSELYLETWPKAGILLNGVCLQHPTWERLINENESGLAGNVWVTPNTLDSLPPKSLDALAREAREGRSKPANLRDQVANGKLWEELSGNGMYENGSWPTPKAGDADFATPRTSGRSIERTTHLQTAVNFWPSPKARDTRSGGTDPERIESWIQSRTEKNQPLDLPDIVAGHEAKNKTGMWRTPHASDTEGGVMEMREGASGHYKLRDHVQDINRSFWPTPRHSEYKGVGPLDGKSHKHMLDRGTQIATIQENERKTGKLNPEWVEWLMGWPIGWTSLEPLPVEHVTAWLDGMVNGWWWVYDPADLEPSQDWRSPSAQEPGIKVGRLETKSGELGGQERHYDKETGRLAQIGLPQQVEARDRESASGYIPRLLYKGQYKPANVTVRIKALGNGQVPLCSFVAHQLLLGD